MNLRINKLPKDIFFNNLDIKDYEKTGAFANAAKALLEQQKSNWKQLAAGYKSLQSVKLKTFEFDEFEIKVQFNPGRIISSSAKVDNKSIRERVCFLCYENLPKEQNGILYGDQYLILCNPFPIFPEHFTVPHIDHLPQSIKLSFDTLLNLGKDLSKYYIVFYNGSKCGASAPDHLHFQAGTKFFMPIDNEFYSTKNRYAQLLMENEHITVTGINDGLRKFLSIDGKDRKMIKTVFEKFYDIYAGLNNKNNEEPMLNIIVQYESKTGWRILIFLREKHRPSHYYKEGNEKILLSPAAVDLGGVCITPRERDFDKITRDDIVHILQEVSLGKEYFEYIKARLQKEMKITTGTN